MESLRDGHATVPASTTVRWRTSSSLRRASPCRARLSECAPEAWSFPDENDGYIQGREPLRLCESRRRPVPHHSSSGQTVSRRKRAFLPELRRQLGGCAWNAEYKVRRHEHQNRLI